jgi:hypothetical protein
LRGAQATKQSSFLAAAKKVGLLRYARNDSCFWLAASFRMQSGHRQSLASAGIGRRNDSSAHQQPPDRLQENSVPQAEQARRRGAGVPNRFVMNPNGFVRGINPGFIPNGAIIRDKS